MPKHTEENGVAIDRKEVRTPQAVFLPEKNLDKPFLPQAKEWPVPRKKSGSYRPQRNADAAGGFSRREKSWRAIFAAGKKNDLFPERNQVA